MRRPFAWAAHSLQFHDDGQIHGITFGGLIQVAAQIVLDGRLDGGPVPDPLALAPLDGFQSHLPQFVHQFLGLLNLNEAAGDDVGAGDDGAILAGKIHADHDHAVLS